MMNLAVLLLHCKNEPRVTTLTRERVHQLTTNVAGYLLDQSGGRELLEFRVFDWFELPFSGADWNALQFNAGATVVPLVEQGQQVDLAPYGHFVLVIDKADANSAAWNSPGPLKYNHMAARSLNPAILGHELGHMYGANHANLDTPTAAQPFLEYGDQYCIMGNEGNKFTFVEEPLHAVGGPGMGAPTLIGCNWLDVNQPHVTQDIRQLVSSAPNEASVTLTALRGAPAKDYAGLPVVALADSYEGNQRLLLEFRALKEWDRGMPNSTTTTNGWVLAHLTNGTKPGASSLLIGSVAANVGAQVYLPQAAVTIRVEALNAAQNAVTLNVSRLRSAITHLFSGGDGVLYAVMNTGELLWYRHDGRGDGNFRWADNNGRKVGTGWNAKHVFSGGNGVIYAINDANDLLWFRHDGRSDGSFKWADNNARKVGTGWNMKQVFSGGYGVIYAINDNNDLLWFRHDGRSDGSFKWADNNARKVGTGWSTKHVFSALQ
jgi:Tachylectin